MGFSESKEQLKKSAKEFCRAGKDFLREGSSEASRKAAPHVKNFKKGVLDGTRRLRAGLERFLDDRDKDN